MVKPSILPIRETHFSWLRTRMSVERTLMSWIRTSTALIGFGFTIFQFFERFSQMEGVAPPKNPNLVRTVALLLIVLGTAGTFVGLIEYRNMVHYMWSDEFRDIAGVGEKPPLSPIFVIGVCILGVGLYASVSVFTRTISGH
ncbi:MAG TPA: DUF202 domain-containing protein [Gemmatimonadaceae bacterium]|nr:DUF202 domain-containing protein [Gemmatimonadaceae bacterium]